MSNDAARDRLTEALARLQDQLADITALQEKQAALTVNAQAADGTVDVTVNAQGQLVKTAIDKSYLDDHDFDDLGEYITEAAQLAARDATKRVAEMRAPITERRKSFPSFSDIVDGLPDPADLMPPGFDGLLAMPQRREASTISANGDSYDDGDNHAEFPTVRR